MPAESGNGLKQQSGTYAGPMPPEVSGKAVEYAKHELQEVACHYGFTDAELEDDLLEIADYIDSVCVTGEEDDG